MYEKLQILNESGAMDTHYANSFDPATLLECYRAMSLIRQFDQKAVALQRTGQLGTYPSCLGQEAFSTGISLSLNDDDVLVPYYRDQAAQYLRGVPLHQLLMLWGGDERGNDFQGVGREDLPVCVPIATQITHAAGIASAFKIRGQHRAVVATCGEGATSRGDFYESLNLAGVWQLPMVVVVNNNQWAISVPRELQTGCDSFAQKAIAAGVEGRQVDGNDVCAVYLACQQALKKARAGKGATLIEAVTYRLGDHTTADDASRYRSNEEVKAAWAQEPLKRLQNYLHDAGLWSPEQEQTLQNDIAEEIDVAVQTYLAQPPQKPEELFDYLFETLPYSLTGQRDLLVQKANQREGTYHGH